MNHTILNVDDTRLEGWVDSYYDISFPDDMPSQVIPPLGMPVLKFHYGCGAEEFYRSHSIKEKAFCIGQITQPVLLEPRKGVSFIGINFSIWGMYRLFDAPMSKLVNTFLPLSFIESKSTVEAICHKLENCSSPNERRSVLEEYLLGKTESRTLPSVALRSFAGLCGTPRQPQLAQCTRYAGVSLRTAQRFFELEVGITAKLYGRIKRVLEVSRYGLQQPDLTLNECVENLGFSDQAHMIREFRTFFSQSPLRYLQNPGQFATSVINVR